MLFIICGPDRAGKSSTIEALANYLKEKYPDKNIRHYHFGASLNEENGRLIYSTEMVNLTNLAKDDIVICDRFHGGEYVYSPMYRNYSGEFIFDFEKQYLDFENTYLVLCYAKAETLIARNDGKSLSQNNIDKIKNELERFEQFYFKSNIRKKIIVRSDVNSTEEIIKDIVHKFKI